MSGAKSGLVVVKLLFLLLATQVYSSSTVDHTTHSSAATTTTPATTTKTTTFEKYHYNRIIFIYFSQNVTQDFYRSALDKLFEFDSYCGGENVQTIPIFGGTKLNDTCLFYCSLMELLEPARANDDPHEFNYYRHCITPNVSVGHTDHKDVKNLTRTLLKDIGNLTSISTYFTVPITSQVILITDYATDSLKNENTTIDLAILKEQFNIAFIALTTNISIEILNESFPSEVWDVVPDFMNWTPDSGMNPICSYNVPNYTTPSPPFSGTSVLNIYLLFSSDYINTTEFADVIELLDQLPKRRWQNPCRQYRQILLKYTLPQFISPGISGKFTCFLEDANFSSSNLQAQCSTTDYEVEFGWYISNNLTHYTADDATCADCFDPYIFYKFIDDDELIKSKHLLITDLPLPPSCSYASNVTAILRDYTDYSSGAPLTVIAIDKKNETSVADSYASLFPPTQRPNLYPVKNITELLPNITKTINFCLDSVPWLPFESIVSYNSSEQPSDSTVWYFYLIGGVVFVALLIAFAILIIKRRKSRKDKLREIGAYRKESTDTIEETPRQNEYTNKPSATTDIWEISLKSLDIDYKTSIGKGAFAIVYSGFLHGKAPVLDIYPSIALQQYVDCEVAIKTVPQHSDDNDISKFRNEIQLMKDIGFHVHLVSILGYNCSIGRPILVMELVEQSLLQWLKSNSSMAIETDTPFDKILLSIAWQVSDGMSYLSSKKFVHRDLAARNVLLNKEMKAMVSDFGLCRKLENAEQVLAVPGGRLPLKWLALESLLNEQFSIKTDVWSFGVLLFEIYSFGEEPYPKLSGADLLTRLQKGYRLEKPRAANELIYDLMKRCWQVDPAERPNFITIQTQMTGMLADSVANYGYLPTTEKNLSET